MLQTTTSPVLTKLLDAMGEKLSYLWIKEPMSKRGRHPRGHCRCFDSGAGELVLRRELCFWIFLQQRRIFPGCAQAVMAST